MATQAETIKTQSEMILALRDEVAQRRPLDTEVAKLRQQLVANETQLKQFLAVRRPPGANLRPPHPA